MAKTGRSKVSYREKIVEEIISSEKSYLDNLDILLKHFLDSSACEKILSKQEISVLFGDLRSIRLVNQVLYDAILSLPICDAFGKLTPFLKVYSAYARNFSSSQDLLQKLNVREPFVKWCDRQEQLPVVKGLKLPALLIVPIQRIPRYKLLLEDLMRYSNTDDTGSLNEALQLINVVADSLNSSVAEFENTAKMIEIQKSFGQNAPKIVIPGRKFIKGEYVQLIKSHYPLKLKRKLFLFSDAILYAKEDSTGSLHSCCLLPIRRCHLFELDSSDNFGFKIMCGKETVTFCCETPLAVSSWVEAISSAISAAKRNRATLFKESTIVEPQYRPQLSARRNSSITNKWKMKRQKNEVKLIEAANKPVQTPRKRKCQVQSDTSIYELIPNDHNSSSFALERHRNEIKTTTVVDNQAKPVPMPRKRKSQVQSDTSISELICNDHNSISFAFDGSSSSTNHSSGTENVVETQKTPKRQKPWWAEYETVEETNNQGKKTSRTIDRSFSLTDCCVLL